MNRLFVLWVLALVCLGPWREAVLGHVGSHPSVHDTTAGIIRRLKGELKSKDLKKLTAAVVKRKLTGIELDVLGRAHITFAVNVPVVVTVLSDVRLAGEPFWLEDRQFTRIERRLKFADVEFQEWQKEFPAGPVGLGVNSFKGGNLHYVVLLKPSNPSDSLVVTDLYPGQLRAGVFKKGEKPYADRDEKLGEVPADLEGRVLIQTLHGSRDDARLVDVLRYTPYPSSRRPDHMLLTWSGDPRTTQSIQWRTSVQTASGVVAFKKKSMGIRQGFHIVKARTEVMYAPELIQDGTIHWHSVMLANLEPATTYLYSVGDGRPGQWSDLSEFTTAPAHSTPFSFIYMGDAQNGLERWGTLVRNAHRKRPDAAFYVMAGDLVNRGAERDDWDSLFYHSRGVYDRRQVVPALGNHECQGGEPKLYLQFFNLRTNGPPSVTPERAYSFEYSNALFVVLDSNLAPEKQSEWLDAELGKTKATWKFVVYHHPAYSSAPKRDNKPIREVWGPIFDKHHVDLALQGHDHAYLRTFPMKGDKRTDSPEKGTIYIVSVSGTKHYDQDARDYTEFGMTNVSTYQVLDVRIDGNQMIYRAFDIEGRLRDELIIKK